MNDLNHVRSVLSRSYAKRIAAAACAALLAASLIPQRASADEKYRLEAGKSGAVNPDRSQWRPVLLAYPGRDVTPRMIDDAKRTAASTVPFYSASITSPLDHKAYEYFMVGTNPLAKTKSSTTVSYIPIALKISFDDGTVLDPTKPGCGDTVSIANRFAASPIFTSVPEISNGINVGTTQFEDGFQRAEFWSVVKGSNYHILLKSAATLRLLDVTAPGYPTSGGACSGSTHRLGEIDEGAYDSLLQEIAAEFATPTQVPVIFSYNIVLTSGGQCCILGYHSDFARGSSIQVYGTGTYLDAGFGIPDISVWAHELGELINDPFVDNATPAWGHTGQVSGCQANLEVGDPLTGTTFALKANGYTYHPQQLTFFDWFYRTPSKGTAGKYSYQGKFTKPQGVCK